MTVSPVTHAAPRLVVIDDESIVLPALERYGRKLGFDVVTFTDAVEAIRQLSLRRPDVAMVDLQMPEVGGLDVLKAIRAADPECQVILMTGNPTIDSAIEAVKLGALDYLSKPIDFVRLGDLLSSVLDAITRREVVLRTDADMAGRLEFHGMIGRSAVMQDLFTTIRRLAPHVRTVLVTGETGTGKELVARALHDIGPRRSKKFVTVNCSAVVENLFESELFGHVRGAFTGATDTKVGLFEHADGGTIFLDEAGELPLALQAKLLRAVEYGEVQRVGSLDARRVDVEVIAATNRDLHAEAEAGRFRSDLYYRLSIIEVHLPPLRERREDIPYLTAAFVRECAQRLGRTIAGLTAGAERALQQSPWHGNIRELRNVLERACILSDGRLLTEQDLLSAMARPTLRTVASATPPLSSVMTPAPSASQPPAAAPELAGDSGTGADLLTTAQRDQIERVLREEHGNKAAAAKRLGVSRRSIYRWLERLNADRDAPS